MLSENQDKLQEELTKIERAIADQEALRDILTDEQIDMVVATLRAQQKTLKARAEDSGVIAQDHSVAVGEGIGVGGDMTGPVIKGDNNSVTYIIRQFLQEDESLDVDKAKLRQQIAGYLCWMQERYGTIELRGVRREGSQVVQLELEKVYVPLRAVATSRSSVDMDEVPMDEVLRLGNRLIVTGGPGSGKTTVLQHIAWTLSSAIEADDLELAHNKIGLPLEKKVDEDKKLVRNTLPLPILLPLSAYAQRRRAFEASRDPAERTLANFVSYYLIEQQSGLDLPNDFFVRLLKDGKDVILLLDGLDEVPDEHERVVVREAIENLVSGREYMRVVVTCRTKAHRGRTALGRGFRELQVEPLGDSHVEALVTQAYQAVYPNDPVNRNAKTEELLNGIQSLESERRQRMGEQSQRLIDSPLMVRMLLVVHLSQRRFPQHRAELYMRTADTMLWPEHTLSEEVAARIGSMVGNSLESHRELVQHLAFSMHSRGEKLGREIEENILRSLLAESSAFAPLRDDFLALTRLRGTLLEERMGTYRFIHLAFQEYLSARYLAEVMRDEDRIARFLEGGPILETWWREVILLVAGYLSITAPTVARRFLQRLAGTDTLVSDRKSLSPDMQLRAAEMAGTATLEWMSGDEDLRREIAGRIVEILGDYELVNISDPLLRSFVGDVLAELGDLRFRADAWFLPDEPMLGFVEIPVGLFQIGEGRKQNTVDLSAFYIARHPTTVAQFQAFMDATDFKLGYSDSSHDPATRPVRHVNWFDALAYCDWLTETLKTWEQTPKALAECLVNGWRFTLPTEAQWEKAARSDDGRTYPWGEDADPNKANYDDTGIGDTSAVGCFLSGRSRYGVEDMSGNVWEWTRSSWEKTGPETKLNYPYNPTDGRENLDASSNYLHGVRGGAFHHNAMEVRCAYCTYRPPDSRYDDFGFRVVFSPSTSDRRSAEL